MIYKKFNKNELITLYTDKQLSYAKIAKIYNCHPETIRQYIKSCNVKSRRVGTNVAWNKGFTKNTDNRVKAHAQGLKEKFKKGILKFRDLTPTQIIQRNLKLSLKTGGPRLYGGIGKHSKYIKKDGQIFYCQSTMEHKMCEILDILNLKWTRNNIGFRYTTLEGKLRRYYPDFYIGDYKMFLETKGYLTPEIQHKLNTSNVPNLRIITYLKFGGNFELIYNKPELLLDILEG